MNPLMPEAGDILLAGAVLLNAVLVVLALVVLLRATDKSNWVAVLLVTMLVPIAGPIVALVALRRRALRATTIGPARATL